MSKILYKNAEINYVVRGKGPKRPLVLLHGFMEDLIIWEELNEQLKKERKIISIDLPGHGRSGGFGEIHSMASMADAVKVVLEQEDVQEISMAGHSMGGYVCLELLNKFPMIVKSLVLINSTPAADSKEKKQNRDRAIPLVRQNQRAFQGMAITNLFEPRHREEYQLDLERLKSRAFGMKPENIIAAIRGMKIRTDYSMLFKSFEGQKMIIAGKDDPVLEFRELKKLARYCNSEFFALENGHMSFIEDKKELIRIMRLID